MSKLENSIIDVKKYMYLVRDIFKNFIGGKLNRD